MHCEVRDNNLTVLGGTGLDLGNETEGDDERAGELHCEFVYGWDSDDKFLVVCMKSHVKLGFFLAAWNFSDDTQGILPLLYSSGTEVVIGILISGSESE